MACCNHLYLFKRKQVFAYAMQVIVYHLGTAAGGKTVLDVSLPVIKIGEECFFNIVKIKCSQTK